MFFFSIYICLIAGSALVCGALSRQAYEDYSLWLGLGLNVYAIGVCVWETVFGRHGNENPN